MQKEKEHKAPFFIAGPELPEAIDLRSCNSDALLEREPDNLFDPDFGGYLLKDSIVNAWHFL
jgi:hypothetical protein